VKDLLQQTDLLIKDGKGRLARALLFERLKERSTQPLERSSLADFANRLRRVGEFEQSIKILNPMVRPKVKAEQTQATNNEKLEYAASLIQIAAVREGVELLQTLDLKKNSQGHLFLAFAAMGRWDYSQAVKHLRKHLDDPLIAGYEKLVGQVNLSDSLVEEGELDEALILSSQCLIEAKKKNYGLLLGNLFQIQARAFLAQKNTPKAQEVLNEAQTYLEQTENRDALYVQKWQAIVEAVRKGMTKNVQRQFEAVREQAFLKRNWETLRDCDFHQARIDEDFKLARHVYFGTPYGDYRRRFQRYWQKDFGISYDWRIDGGRRKAKHHLDLLTCENSAKAPLKAGQAMHRLLKSLASDFYKPATLPGLFSEVFPGQYWDPYSSRLALHQVLWRLRDWMKDSKLPLQIHESNGFYSLSSYEPMRIKTRALDETGASHERLRLTHLISKVEKRLENRSFEFNLRDAGRWTSIPERTLSRYFSKAIELGVLEKRGEARATRYVLKNWTSQKLE